MTALTNAAEQRGVVQVNTARAERVAQEIQYELARMLSKEVKDPRIGFVSLTRVELSRDLSWAKVFVSVLGTEEERAGSLAGLHSASSFLRGEIGRRLHLRLAPSLQFLLDDSIDQSLHIQRLMREVNRSEHDT